MKKLFAFVFAMGAIYSVSAQSENVRFGIKAGGNMAKLHVTPEQSGVSEKYKLGYYGGGLVEFSFPKGSKWKLQGEVLYNANRSQQNYSGGNTKYELNQVNIPVFAKYFVTPAFSINAGLSANFNTAYKATMNATGIPEVEYDFKKENELNTFQPGAMVGFNYYIHQGLFIDARYNTFFGNTLDISGSNTKHNWNNFQLGIGYKFKKG